LLAQLLARRGDSEQALNILERGLTDAGAGADLLVLQSSLLGKKGDHERSLAAAKKAVEIAPQNFDALLALTGALERSGAAAQALEAASNLAKTFPERDDLCLLLWELHGGQGNFERAVAYYRALSTVVPSSPSVWMYLGAAERRAGQLDAAERDLLKAVELAPGSLDPQNELASLRQVQGKLDEAAKLFARVAREDNPLKEQAFERVQVLAGMLARNLKFDAAIELFEELRRIDPRNYDASANRALALRQAGRVAESETAYREALAMFPGDRVLTNDLGLLLLGVGRREEARAMLEEAEKLGSLDAAENLAVLDLQRGEARSAEARLEHVLSSDRTRARAMVALETARQRR
jgi:Flp pilus assembly protein TadD